MGQPVFNQDQMDAPDTEAPDTEAPDTQARYSAILPAPFGMVGVRVARGQVLELAYLPPGTPPLACDDALVQRVASQLDAYYANPDAAFDLPLAPLGSGFQQRVWQAIRAVPRGATTTYGTIATSLQGTARAVGQACGQNPFPVVVPCHRVVSARGVGGFSHHAEDGFFLDVKRWLLRHEGALLL